MKTRNEIERTLCDIIADQLQLNPVRVSASSRVASDLGADSLDRMEIVMAAEEEFSVRLPDEIAESDYTVAALAAAVEKALQDQKGE